MAHTAPRWVPASLATAKVAPGLTWPPQEVSVSASPAATRMLRAAFTSRSWTVPHARQVQARILNGLGPSRYPHRAGLGGWCPAADLDDLTPVLGGLGLQQPDKHGPPSVVDALGQPRPGQPRHGEVLDGDRLVLADQPQGELVVMVGSPVADLAVGDRHPHPGLGAIGGSFLLPGEGPLGVGQALFGGAQ